MDLLGKKSKDDPEIKKVNIEFKVNSKLRQIEGIVKNKTIRISYDNWKKIVQEQIKNYSKLSDKTKELLSYVFENKLIYISSQSINKELLSNELDYKKIIADLYYEMNKTKITNLDNITPITEHNVLVHILNPKNLRLHRLINELTALTKKNENELTLSDFLNSLLDEEIVDYNYLFSSQIELIFFNYAKRRELNRKLYFYKKEDGIENNSISDDEFLKKYPPPWEIINNILENHNLDFSFIGIKKGDFTDETIIDLSLIKNSAKQKVPFNDLSSGEKVIISLIISIFTSQYYGNDLTYPDLIILDEPDVHLHPEMTKLLLDILIETFNKKLNIKVIMSSHSPTTIALAPESSIYQITNGVKTNLKKITKDEALNILTNFIPTLSIDYNNHKQVFVESPSDVAYYQRIFDKHHQNKPQSNKIYFISNSYGKGNCSQVYKTVNELRKYGNSTCFGIVDWDKNNTPQNFVFVHGLNERYNLESFLFDPIYIICLLMELNNAHNICSLIGLDLTYNQYLIGNENSERLQGFIEFFFNEFEKNFPSYMYDSEKQKVFYLNDKKLEIPKWYLLMQGHQIVEKVKIVFPALNKFMQEGEIQNSLSVIVSKCYPFVPLTTIQLLEEIK